MNFCSATGVHFVEAEERESLTCNCYDDRRKLTGVGATCIRRYPVLFLSPVLQAWSHSEGSNNWVS
jgi:hypothetical protein